MTTPTHAPNRRSGHQMPAGDETPRNSSTGNDGRLIVMIGAAGAGKSTLAAQGWPGQVLSLDALRDLVSGDECDQDATADAVAVLHALVAARLRRKVTTVVDATNVTPAARRPLLDLASAHRAAAIAVVVDTPLPVALARNAARPGPRPGARWGRRVPDQAIHTQHRALRSSLPRLRAEGFTEIRRIDASAPAGDETAAGPASIRRGGRPAPPHDETACPYTNEVTRLRAQVVQLQRRLDALGPLAEMTQQIVDLPAEMT